MKDVAPSLDDQKREKVVALTTEEAKQQARRDCREAARQLHANVDEWTIEEARKNSPFGRRGKREDMRFLVMESVLHALSRADLLPAVTEQERGEIQDLALELAVRFIDLYATSIPASVDVWTDISPESFRADIRARLNG